MFTRFDTVHDVTDVQTLQDGIGRAMRSVARHNYTVLTVVKVK